MTPAYAYLRVSGRAQIDGDGFTRQYHAIDRFTQSSNLEIQCAFTDGAVSGTTEADDRQAWVDMIDAMNRNNVKTIVIEKLDRLARDLLVQEHIIADIATRGITILSAHEPDLCSSDPTRVLMRQIMGAIAQYDKSMLVMKLRASRQRQKLKHGRCEGNKPYGHYPDEKPVLSQIMHSMLPCHQLANHLNACGSLSRKGTPWNRGTINRILKNSAKNF